MARKLKNEPHIHIDSLEIGKRIAATRKQKGLTQKQLSEIIGIKQTLVSDYETGRVRMFAEMIGRIALALEVQTDELIGLDRIAEEIPQHPLRIMKRVTKLETLPQNKQKQILQTIDSLIRDAESTGKE